MADRTVVRQGPVVSLALGAIVAMAALGAGPEGTGAAPPTTKTSEARPVAASVPIEQRPYRIRAWVAVDPRARVDHRGRETLVARWKIMVGRFVGAPWDVEVAEGDGPLAVRGLDDVTAEMVIGQAKGFDKAWLFKVEPDGGGLVLAGREFDAATAKVGLICRRPATLLADAPRAMLRLALDLFSPSAEIGEATAGRRILHVQGASLPAADALGQVVSVGSVFQPTRIFYKPDGGVQLITPIKSTYLRVEAVEAGVANCAIISALRNPLTDKTVGRARMVAVGLKPASIPTRLRFVTAKPEERPAAGYNLTARPAPDGTPREVGTTDREGRIVLEPGFADGLVILRLMAAGIEPLAEFPIMPGEQVEERTLIVDTKPQTVQAESELHALRDEIVDLIAVRHRLETRLKGRADAENWGEVKILLDEYRTLTPRSAVEARLAKLDSELTSAQQKAPRKPIRTRTAQNLLADTRGLIDRYLDDEGFAAYQDAWERATSQATATKTAVKPLPKAAPVLGSASTKPDAAGLVVLAPAGAGFSVTLPGSPVETTSKTADGASEIRTYRLDDPTKGRFTVAYWDYPLALTPADTPRVIDSERDRLATALPGAKVVRDQPVTIGGLEGRDIEFEGAGARGKTSGIVARIFLANSRVVSATFAGSKDALSSKPATDFLDSLRLTGRSAAASPPPTTAAAPPAPAAAPPAEAPKPAPAPAPAATPKPQPANTTPF